MVALALSILMGTVDYFGWLDPKGEGALASVHVNGELYTLRLTSLLLAYYSWAFYFFPLIGVARLLANRAAVRYADAVTAELRSEQQKLVRTNAELEQFAYAASHDLKTPIRGIGGLVDMLREDLQDFLSKQEVGEAVSVSLDLIEDRVERMNDLTNGIIEFARIDPNYEKCRPLDLSELSRSLATDFDLQPDQIVLKSDINTISVDPIGLRRVIENLVGNAVKYHDQVGNLVVTVSCTDAPGSLQFSVSDNKAKATQ